MRGSQTKQARAGGFSLALGTSTVPSNREDILQLLAGQTQHEGGRDGCITLFMTRDYGALAQHRCAASRHIPARCSAQMMAAIPLASSRARCSLCAHTDPERALLKPRHRQHSSHRGKYPLPPSPSSLGPWLPPAGSLRGSARRDRGRPPALLTAAVVQMFRSARGAARSMRGAAHSILRPPCLHRAGSAAAASASSDATRADAAGAGPAPESAAARPRPGPRGQPAPAAPPGNAGLPGPCGLGRDGRARAGSQASAAAPRSQRRG